MKNITAFRRFVSISTALLLGTLVFPLALQGQTEADKPEAGDFPYYFSVSPAIGFLYGQGEEILYEDEGSGAYQSELLWDIKPLVYSGLVLDVSPKKNPGFFYSISLKFGFPITAGIMEDRDWLAWNGMLSHYSRHNSKIEEAWFHSFLGGITLPLGSRVLLKPFLGAAYTHIKWNAFDGYTKYAKKDDLPLEDSDPEVPISGEVVSYTQEWLVLHFGLSLSCAFHPRFSAGLSLRSSPLLYFTGVDEHHKRSIRYNDYILGGLYLEPGGEFVFNFNKWFSAGLYVSWRYMRMLHGVSYEQTGDGLYAGYPPGAAWQTLDSSLRALIRF
ncbi:MAG: omptin family outer membrane protease [Treponema sp.]|nr:omptin family outer membrane protease [Treponema sp.]